MTQPGPLEPNAAAAGDPPDAADTPELRHRRFRQFIPRPSSAAAGGPAPWAGVPPPNRNPISLDRVAAALGPVLAAPFEEPEHRPHASVLVPLFERAGDTHVVLIRRSMFLMSSPGDLAFPGGRLEPDERALDAALREAEEEVALDPRSVSVLGRLTVVSRARVHERVVPYVGLLRSEPRLRREPSEVDAILTVSLSDLAADGVYWEEEWQIPGAGRRFLSFFADPATLGDDVLWGMTATVIRELLTAVLSTPEPPPPL
jgi:8-oxo-dGTP pyrophosphatase MutT (NUDIX family)